MNTQALGLRRGDHSHVTAQVHGLGAERSPLIRWSLSGLISLITLCSSGAEALARPSLRAPVDFTLISIERPLLRRGKRLTTPRRVVLFASRPPLSAELGRSQGGQRWEGSTMDVFRAKPIKVSRAELSAQEDRFIERFRALTALHVERHEQSLRDEAARFVSERLRPIAPSRSPRLEAAQAAERAAGSAATLPSSTELGEDDDELSVAPVETPEAEPRLEERGARAPADGQLCGAEGQPCCEQGFESPCEGLLSCQAERVMREGSAREQWRCLPPPEPCGGYGQACCAEAELACLFEGLACSGADGAGRCFMPPLPAPERRLKVGELKVIKVRGRFIEAEVSEDRLVGSGVHAVMKGDKALLRSGR